MYAPLGMANEWTFKMNADRTRPAGIVGSRPNCFAQMFKRAQCVRQRRRHCGGQVAGNAVPEHSSLNRDQSRGTKLHHIMTRTTMNVDVNKTGDDGLAREFMTQRTVWHSEMLTGSQCNNSLILNNQNRLLNDRRRS